MDRMQSPVKKKKIITILLIAFPMILFISDCFYWYFLEKAVTKMTFRTDMIKSAMADLPIETLKHVDRMKGDMERTQTKHYIVDDLKKVRPQNMSSMTHAFVTCLSDNGLPPTWLNLRLETYSKTETIYKLGAGFHIHRDSAEERGLMACIDRDPLFSGIKPIDIRENPDDGIMEISATLYRN